MCCSSFLFIHGDRRFAGKNRIAEMKQQEKEARGGTPGFSVLIVLMV
jgi:hypothetical protein